MVGDYIVCAAYRPGGGDVLVFCQQKFRVDGPAVAAIAGDEPAVDRLLRVYHRAADRFALGTAFAGMQRHDADRFFTNHVLAEIISVYFLGSSRIINLCHIRQNLEITY